jgi:hypothetical protein
MFSRGAKFPGGPNFLGNLARGGGKVWGGGGEGGGGGGEFPGTPECTTTFLIVPSEIYHTE